MIRQCMQCQSLTGYRHCSNCGSDLVAHIGGNPSPRRTDKRIRRRQLRDPQSYASWLNRLRAETRIGSGAANSPYQKVA